MLREPQMSLDLRPATSGKTEFIFPSVDYLEGF